MNFTVGPAQLYTGVADFYGEALSEGWGEVSHRSPRFTEMSKNTIESMKRFYNIPSDYKIYYTYSATESLELVSKMLCKEKVCHVSNGNFGNMWTGLSEMAGKKVQKISAQENTRNNISQLDLEDETEMLCITANETSSGIAYTPEEITTLHALHPNVLLSVDCTSGMGAVAYDFSSADSWSFSVQKALGMPAGLGILILSPRAFAVAEKNAPEGGHHNIMKLEGKMKEKFQTPTTPNVLSIAALGFVIEQMEKDYGTIENLYACTQKKAALLYEFFEQNTVLHPAIASGAARSESVIVVEGDEADISFVYEELMKKGIEVGKGYGPKKTEQLRIANFPVYTEHQIRDLIHAFTSFSS